MVIRQGYKRGQIGPSYRGAFYTYDVQGGSRTAAWPPKRGKPKTPAQAFTQALFAECCRAMKAMDPTIINYARENCKGTPMLPRDGLMAALYGRGPTFILPNGERRFSMATRVDMSMLMDNIAWKPGSILYRGSDDLWIGLDPGGVGQVLTVGEGLMPSWQDPKGGGGGSYIWCVASSLSGSAHATKGGWFNPMVTGEIPKVVIVHQFTAGQQLSMRIYRLNGSNVIQEVLADQPIVTTQDGTTRTLEMPVDPPAAFSPGDRIAICVSQIGAGNTVALRVMNAGTYNVNFPATGGTGYAQIDQENPAVGQTMSVVAGAGYSVSWECA